jgi:hypothetical protein
MTQFIHSKINRLKLPIIFGVLFMTNRHSNLALTPTSSDFVHCTYSARISESEMGESIEFDRCGVITIRP